jgi:hypothetical protein
MKMKNSKVNFGQWITHRSPLLCVMEIISQGSWKGLVGDEKIILKLIEVN